MPCCHCIALRKHKLAKTTLYASQKLKSTGKRSAADGITHEDELIEAKSKVAGAESTLKTLLKEKK